jgi:methionyl-tRNA synthetase
MELKTTAANSGNHFERHMQAFSFHKGIQTIWEFISVMNKTIDTAAPWQLAKDPERKAELRTVIYNLLEGLRIISGLIYPIMPDTAKTMQGQLGLDSEAPFYFLERLLNWGELQPGIGLPKFKPLFPRIEAIPEPTGRAADALDQPNQIVTKPLVSIDAFAKLDLRIATIVAAEAVPKSKKLLKIEIDMGEPRTIVSGIAESYQPKDLIGKQVVVVANLKPAKLMGITSQGMLLSADADVGFCLLTPDAKTAPGSAIS